jgi:hypothetical protein
MSNERPVLLQPSVGAYVRGRGAVLPVAAIGLVALGLSAARLPRGLELYILAVAVLLGMLGLYFRVVRIEVGPAAVRKRTIFGVTYSWPRADVGGCALRSITFPGISRPVKLVIVYGVDHRALFAVSPDFWEAQLPHRLGVALGHPHPPSLFQDTTKADVQEEFPGALPFAWRHNWLVGVGVGLVILALIVVYVRAYGRHA